MTEPEWTVARLTAERDRALARSQASLNAAQSKLRGVDTDIVNTAKAHPLVALGGAIAVGATAGMVLNGRPVRGIIKGASAYLLGPLAGQLFQRFLRVANDELKSRPDASDAT